MFKKFAPLAFGSIAAVLAACGHGGSPSMGGASSMLPQIAPDLSVRAILPEGTAGENLPDVLGKTRAGHMAGLVAGFTQTRYSQSLAFPPGTKLEIRNLSKTDEHTFDVVAQLQHATGKFPANPHLSMTARGRGILGPGYASGVIKPGKSVTVTLSNPGIYIVGCAFHYSIGMRDVIEIDKGAKPGSEATAPPSSQPTSKPTATPPGGGGW